LVAVPGRRPVVGQLHVGSIFTRLNLPEADDDHRRVLAVVTFLEAR
jgi:hypothetical protein